MLTKFVSFPEKSIRAAPCLSAGHWEREGKIAKSSYNLTINCVMLEGIRV